MKLEGVALRNFRGHKESWLSLADITALIGRNDAGKSTILEALDAFFNDTKVEAADLCKLSALETGIEVACTFSGFPEELIIDDAAKTTLAQEYLLNSQGKLEVVRRWKTAGKLTKATYVCAHHPSADKVDDLLSLKLKELRERAESLGVTISGDARKLADIRKAIYASIPDLKLETKLVELDKVDGKAIWSQLEAYLPMYALFKADRATSDEDDEAQGPLGLAVKQAVRQVEDRLNELQDTIRAQIQEVADRTVAQLQKIDPTIAATLSAQFKTEPKWDSLFKVYLTGESDIRMNRRGSGVKRLILLSFLIAEAERKRSQSARQHVIYAVEEPETALHPQQQAILLGALNKLASGECQVLLTTHSPSLAGMLDTSSLRLVHKDAEHGLASVEEPEEDARGGSALVARIAAELGVLSERTQNVEVVLCVEGPTDVKFLEAAFSALHAEDATIIDLSTDPTVLVLPLGGGTLKQFVEHNFLEKLRVPEVHVYDSDGDEGQKYKESLTTVNARTDGSRGFLTRRREIENYIPIGIIDRVFGVQLGSVGDQEKVAERLAKLGRSSTEAKAWDELDDEKRKKLLGKKKARLNGDCLEAMRKEPRAFDALKPEVATWNEAILNAKRARDNRHE